MAPFPFPNPFRSAHCMNHGQRIPPASPESEGTCPKQKQPRLLFSRFLKKSCLAKVAPQAAAPAVDLRTWAAAQSGQATTPLHPLSFLMPASPTLTADHSTSECLKTPVLRRRSNSFPDLKGFAQQQLELKTSRIPTPPLPSPLQIDEPSCLSTSYFDIENPRTEKLVTGDVGETYASYEDLRILSCYYENSRCCGDFVSYDEEELKVENQEQDYYDELIPSQLLDRSTVCSVESDWFADTKTYDERLRRFRQRCFQVVQHPMSSGITIREDGGHQIKLATVLVGPGKPKMIQIQRPPSISTASKSSSSIAVVAKRPETPEQPIQEISAFSPYDTPMNQAESHVLETPVSIHGYSKQFTSTLQSLIPAPLSIPSYQDIPRVDSAVYMETKDSRIYGDASLASSHFTLTSATTVSPSRSYLPQALSSPVSEAEASSRCWRLERTLDAVTEAIESFPNGILRLDSPAILELRHSTVTDNIHVLCLQKIFPRTAPLLLSALAAWLIVDLYFQQLELDAVDVKYSELATASNDSFHRIPPKARATLGIKLHEITKIESQEEILRNRGRLVEATVKVIGQRLMEALCGSWDEDLWRSLQVLIEVIEAGNGSRT